MTKPVGYQEKIKVVRIVQSARELNQDTGYSPISGCANIPHPVGRKHFERLA